MSTNTRIYCECLLRLLQYHHHFLLQITSAEWLKFLLNDCPDIVVTISTGLPCLFPFALRPAPTRRLIDEQPKTAPGVSIEPFPYDFRMSECILSSLSCPSSEYYTVLDQIPGKEGKGGFSMCWCWC
jgi:hypothetical protein